MSLWSRIMGRREPETSTLVLSVREGSTLDKRLRDIANALVATPQGNSQELIQLIKELKMGLKEDHEALSARFDGMESAVQAVADDIAALKTELKDANDRANIDLSPLVARAEGLETRLRAAAGPNAGTDPESEPEPELPPVGGEEGGGAPA